MGKRQRRREKALGVQRRPKVPQRRGTTTTASRAFDTVGRPVRDPRRSRDAEWSWAEAHEFFRDVALARGMWAGVPAPVGGFAFTLAPGYIEKAREAGITAVMDQRETRETYDDDVGLVRNVWWSDRLGASVYLYETTEEPGRVQMLVDRSHRTPGRRANLLMATMGASTGWDPEAETRALSKLATLIPPHLMTMYRLTGAFMETSRRSGVTYILRRSRPTVVVVPERRGDPDCQMRFLTTLCLHPVGYYSGTFAGGMVPTDDVIAHLLLIRGDEHFLWRKAYQHGGEQPESGL